MAPVLMNSLRGAITSTSTAAAIDGNNFIRRNPVDGPLGEAARTFTRLTKRDDNDPSKGVLDPHDINNAGIFFLFALIGVAFVITGIWFFFWAKNGGFHFKENDWDDYKSTVLRRTGPNGTVLSGATASTDLGGGSVYKEYDDTTTVITESTALSGITAGASDIFAREKRKKKQEKREAERRKRRGEKKKKREFDEGILDERAEKEAQEQLRNYRHERPARVGGLNKESEGSTWDGSTNAAESSVGASSDLLSNRQTTPTSTPTKTSRSSGIRKVYSVADRNANRESERMRAEARRLRDEGRTARRDFSYQRAVGAASQSQLSESLLSGSATGSGSGSGGTSTVGRSTVGTESDVGTKSYYHPMPELKEQRRREREERRARRSGYKRGNVIDEDSEV